MTLNESINHAKQNGFSLFDRSSQAENDEDAPTRFTKIPKDMNKHHQHLSEHMRMNTWVLVFD
jgi:hypothetical protein